MSIRNLDSLFDPRSVAVIGASDRAGSVGATVWRNLREGGFAGPCWAVNLKRAACQTQLRYAGNAGRSEKLYGERLAVPVPSPLPPFPPSYLIL